MNCSNCGESLPEGKLFCPKCGFLNVVAGKGADVHKKEESSRSWTTAGVLFSWDIKAMLFLVAPVLLLSLLELFRLVMTVLFIQNILKDLEYWRRVGHNDDFTWLVVRQAIIYLVAFLSLILAVRTLRKKPVKQWYQNTVLVLIPLCYFAIFVSRIINWIGSVSIAQEGSTLRTNPLTQIFQSSLMGERGELFLWDSNMPELLVTIIFSGLAIYWFKEHKRSQSTHAPV